MGYHGILWAVKQIPPNTEQIRNIYAHCTPGESALGKLRQMACKPGSVLASARDGHSSGTLVAERLARPTRTAAGNCHCRPYLVLLPVGLAVPPSLPKARCALTAPFQPCPDRNPTAVCFLLRFPWSRLRRTLSGTVFPWSPDFPPPFAQHATEGGHPAI